MFPGVAGESAAENYRIEDRGFDARIVASDPIGAPRRPQVTSSMVTTTVAVEGMTCGACTAAIEGGFEGVEGVSSFTVNLITERAVAVHDSTKVSVEKIVEM